MSDKNTTPPAATEPITPPLAVKSANRGWITPALAIVAALVIGLFGGILIGHASGSTSQASSTQRGAFGGAGGAGGTGAAGGFAGGFTAGTIMSIEGDTVILKLTDGSTVKVTTSSTTRVTTSDTAAVTDLKKGETITVVGAKDSSGNVTATSVSEGTTGFGGRTRPSANQG